MSLKRTVLAVVVVTNINPTSGNIVVLSRVVACLIFQWKKLESNGKNERWVEKIRAKYLFQTQHTRVSQFREFVGVAVVAVGIYKGYYNNDDNNNTQKTARKKSKSQKRQQEAQGSHKK